MVIFTGLWNSTTPPSNIMKNPWIYTENCGQKITWSFSHGLVEIGDICITTGQYERAIKYYSKALHIYRNLKRVITLLLPLIALVIFMSYRVNIKQAARE